MTAFHDLFFKQGYGVNKKMDVTNVQGRMDYANSQAKSHFDRQHLLLSTALNIGLFTFPSIPSSKSLCSGYVTVSGIRRPITSVRVPPTQLHLEAMSPYMQQMHGTLATACPNGGNAHAVLHKAAGVRCWKDTAEEPAYNMLISQLSSSCWFSTQFPYFTFVN